MLKSHIERINRINSDLNDSAFFFSPEKKKIDIDFEYRLRTEVQQEQIGLFEIWQIYIPFAEKLQESVRL